MMGEKVPWRRRIARAAFVCVSNAVLWILIPTLLGSLLSQALPSTPLTVPTFVYAFGAAITGLQTLAALTEGMAISVPFSSGGYIASAYYIWAATDGGNLQLSTMGAGFVLSFAPMVYLIMLPPLFGALRVPVAFLLEGNEVARPVLDEV